MRAGARKGTVRGDAAPSRRRRRLAIASTPSHCASGHSAATLCFLSPTGFEANLSRVCPLWRARNERRTEFSNGITAETTTRLFWWCG